MCIGNLSVLVLVLDVVDSTDDVLLSVMCPGLCADGECGRLLL